MATWPKLPYSQNTAAPRGGLVLVLSEYSWPMAWAVGALLIFTPAPRYHDRPTYITQSPLQSPYGPQSLKPYADSATDLSVDVGYTWLISDVPVASSEAPTARSCSVVLSQQYGELGFWLVTHSAFSQPCQDPDVT